MKHIILSVLLLAVCVPVTVTAQTASKADVANVELLLSGYHGLPDKSQLEKIVGVETIVESLSHRRGIVGERALIALGIFWPTPQVFDRYTALLSDKWISLPLRIKIIYAAAQGFGEKSVPILNPLLSDSDPQIRVSTIQALSRIRSPLSKEVLVQALKRETTPFVLAAFEKYLTKSNANSSKTAGSK